MKRKKAVMRLKKNVNQTLVNSHVSLNAYAKAAFSKGSFFSFKRIQQRKKNRRWYMMIPNWLTQRMYLTPHKIALSKGDETWTFQDVRSEERRVGKDVEVRNRRRNNKRTET